jgi:hypothetical protein
MSAQDAGPPPLTTEGAEYGWFDGVLDGRIASAEALRKATRRWAALGLPEPSLDLDGGRFSFLPTDKSFEGALLDQAAQEKVLGVLEDLVGEGAEPGSVESTLRCTLVMGATTVESLFGMAGGELRNVSRQRPVSADDRLRRPRQAALSDSVRSMGLRRALLILVLVGLAFGLSAWRSGWVDRLLAADAQTLAVELGPFEGLVVVELDEAWGKYEVELARGPGYPATPDETASLLAAAPDNARRAAVNLVSNGDFAYLQLLDSGGEVVAETIVGLRGLVGEPEGTVESRLPGRMAARSLRLSLAPHVEDD